MNRTGETPNEPQKAAQDRGSAKGRARWTPPRIQDHGSIRNLVRGATKPAGDTGPGKKAQ